MRNVTLLATYYTYIIVREEVVGHTRYCREKEKRNNQKENLNFSGARQVSQRDQPHAVFTFIL